MTHIMQMNNESGVESLLAAISFHDAWAYLMHNAAEDSLPDIDDSLPRLNTSTNGGSTYSSMIATDPINQMWMQGSPRVFLNNEATPISRSLDAIACAIRTCCDQANCQFVDNAKAAESEVPGILSLSHGNGNGGEQFPGVSPTTSAVLANENELCSRNMVLSAKSLLDQDSGMSNGTIKKHGLYMVSSVMSAFLENGEMEEPQEGTGGGGGGGGNSNIGGFTDGQIRNLLVGCETIIQHPLLLHCPGPIYHMASNAAILLCHLLNGIHAKCGAAGKGGISPSCSNNKVEGILFDEVLDTFMATRKALNIHRKSLPVKLRCHGIPRPSGVGPFKKVNNNLEAPFIDLGDTLMCLCRGCQNFVLMGCSPCVAAERSMKAAAAHATRDRQQSEEKSGYDEFDRELGEVDDLSLDDDALLDVLSRIVQN